MSSADQALSFLTSRAETAGIQAISTQISCMLCLRKCPAVYVPCTGRHSICESCLRRYDEGKGEYEWQVSISKCPLGCNLMRSPWGFRIKPVAAQPRILVLDGYVS